MTTENIVASENREANHPSLEVHIATQAWEKEEIYKLRYQVYVEEMAKNLAMHIHDHQLSDELDDQSLLVFVKDKETIIATARLTINTTDKYPAELVNIFQMQKIQEGFKDTSLLYGLGTKLAIKKQYRNSTALYLIISEFYKILADRGIRFWFGGCNPYLLPLYERMGFRRFAPNFFDEGYGLLVPIVILIDDNDHFQKVRSPLYRLARKRIGNPETSQKFTELFPDTKKILNSRLTDLQDLCHYIEEKLGYSPAILPLFRTTSTKMFLSLLAASAVFSCTTGDYLLEESLTFHDIYLILSGKIAAYRNGEKLILQQGDILNGFHSTVLPKKAVVLEKSELLVIPQQALEHWHELHLASTNSSSANCPQLLTTILNKGDHHE